MEKRNEPSQLRRGKRFEKIVWNAWRDPDDRSFGTDKFVKIEYPPEVAGKNRSGRMDVYFDLSDGSGAAIFEIKATDWDRVKHRRKLLGSHRRQLLKYVDQFLLLKDISVCATIVYPSRPNGPEILREVEVYMDEWCIQIFWYEDDQSAATL